MTVAILVVAFVNLAATLYLSRLLSRQVVAERARADRAVAALLVQRGDRPAARELTDSRPEPKPGPYDDRPPHLRPRIVGLQTR